MAVSYTHLDVYKRQVLNQAALRRSTGTIWLVMGALFLLASLLSFGVVIAAGSGASTPLAITGGVVAIALYGACLLYTSRCV